LKRRRERASYGYDLRSSSGVRPEFLSCQSRRRISLRYISSLSSGAGGRDVSSPGTSILPITASISSSSFGEPGPDILASGAFTLSKKPAIRFTADKPPDT
jgi:hypothetical protein